MDDSQLSSTLQLYITEALRSHSTSHQKLTEKMLDYCTSNKVMDGREAGAQDTVQWKELEALPETLLRRLALGMGTNAPKKPSAKSWYFKCAGRIGEAWGEKTEPEFHQSASCGACNDPMHWLRPGQQFPHGCANDACKKPLHSVFSDLCTRKPYTPTEGVYYCTQQCRCQ